MLRIPGEMWRTVGSLSTVGLSFVLAIVIGTWLGSWIDARFGTRPWGFFLLFALGLAAGILNVYRATSKLR